MLQLYRRVSELLRPWPHLVSMFTEFLGPEDCLEAEAVRTAGGGGWRGREGGVVEGGVGGRGGGKRWREGLRELEDD